MTTVIVYMVIFGLYLAVGIAEQVRVVRQISSMAKTLKEAGYDA
jgi:hypothetical protein